MLRLILLCSLLIVPPSVSGAQEVSEPASTHKAWEKSVIQYRLASSLEGMHQAANPTWNPLVVHSLAFQPGWQFHEILSLSADFQLAQELTQSDWNNDGWYWSDFSLSLAFENVVTIENPQTAFDIQLGLRLPTSKRSQAETLMFEPSLTLSMKQEFKVLKGIGVLVETTISKPFHRATTGELESSPIAICPPTACQSLMQLPTRNVHFSTSQMAAVQFGLGFNLNLAIFYGANQSRVHTLQDDPRISYSVQDPTDWRFEIMSGVSLEHPVIDGISMRYGIASSHPFYKNDGQTINTPLFNRHAMGFLEMNILPAKLF